LARPAALHELTLKLTGWRNRSYPLRVFVDGHQVYAGATPRSLGYVTLPLAPLAPIAGGASGSSVRIALDGTAQDGGATTLTEVANQANIDTGEKGLSTGALSIVEAEFYERPGGEAGPASARPSPGAGP